MPYQNNRYNSNPRNNGYSYNRNGSYNKSTTPKNDSQTDGIMLVNEKMGKFLRTRFWNRFMGIDIGTYQPGTPLDYNTIRNAQTFGHVFSFSTMFELSEICDEILSSIKETNQFETTATVANTKKDVIVEISNGSNINMPNGIYLVIYKDVDTGRRTNSFDIYPFGGTKVLRNYDHNSGSAKEDIRQVGDFKKFTMALREGAKAFTMAQAHAIKDGSKNDKLAGINMLTAIAAKLGVDVQQSVTAATSRTSGQSTYQRDQGPKQYQRTSQPGQWNRNGTPYNRPAPSYNAQQAMAAITDEPVDINLDAATLQQVSLDNFK